MECYPVSTPHHLYRSIPYPFDGWGLPFRGNHAELCRWVDEGQPSKGYLLYIYISSSSVLSISKSITCHKMSIYHVFGRGFLKTSAPQARHPSCSSTPRIRSNMKDIFLAHSSVSLVPNICFEFFWPLELYQVEIVRCGTRCHNAGGRLWLVRQPLFSKARC